MSNGRPYERGDWVGKGPRFYKLTQPVTNPGEVFYSNPNAMFFIAGPEIIRARGFVLSLQLNYVCNLIQGRKLWFCHNIHN